jgi:hypothetical protein
MKKSIFLIITTFLLIACNSNLEKIHYNETDAQPAILQDIENSYILEAQQSNQIAIVFEWSLPRLNYPAAVTTDLQMDIQGSNFAKAITLASTKTDSIYSINTADLNAALIKLQTTSGMEFGPIPVDFRLVSSISVAATPLYSNIVSSIITPFAGEREYPQIWIIGDYCGWNHDNSQFLYSANEDESYSGMICFAGKASNGWKLTPAANWENDWGADGSPAEEAPSIVLIEQGDNLTNYAKNTYQVSFNTSTRTLNMSQGHETWGIVGAYNNWGATPDIEMTLASEVENGKRQYYFTTTLNLKANEGWKIRPDNTWIDDVGPNQVKYEGVEASDGNFIVIEDGNYTIKWYFNKVEEKLVVNKN